VSLTDDATGADEASDATDLTPQAPRSAKKRRRWIPMVVAVVVFGTVGVLAWSLVSGSLFFYNVDEAVERRDDLADERFRVQGTPLAGTVVETFRDETPVVAFSLAFNDEVMDVVHEGDPPDLFQADVPVVLEGAWVTGDAPVDGFDELAADGWHFQSDRMLVKHDNDYINSDEYLERVDEAERGGQIDSEP